MIRTNRALRSPRNIAKFYTVLLFILLTFTSCSPVYDTTYNYTPPPSHEGLMCVDHCMGMKTLCEQTCEAKDAECEYDAKKDARKDYDRYVDSRVKKGREIKKDKYYFENFYSCGATSCKAKCAEDYNSCYGSCGGGINSSLSCKAFCK